MVWMQKNADTINKFSTEKERKKDMKTIYQIKQVYCEQIQLFMSPFTSECYLSRLYAVRELLSNENQKSSPLRLPMRLINSPHLCYTRSNTENGDYYGK